MNRTEALATATTIVDDFAPRTNGRGYLDGTISPAERLTLVLQTADWLLAQNEAPTTGTLVSVASAVRAVANSLQGQFDLCERTDREIVLDGLLTAFGDLADLLDGMTQS